MGLLRYTASADTTITNAFKASLLLRGTGSNMGYADSLEIFSIYGQTSTGSVGTKSQELCRTLIQFPINLISSDRSSGNIPASGSVKFFLKMYNAETPFTLPQDYTLIINPVSSSWNEGSGLDMDEYSDIGAANWISASTTAAWTTIGGDYGTQEYEVNFPQGYENIELDVSGLVEKWMAGTFTNYGVGIRLTGSEEAYFSSSTGANTANLIHNPSGATRSYYTKKFFSRSTEFFFKRPLIEARWDSRTIDNRGDFYYSSSLAPAADNLNTLYIYNYIRGRLKDIPSVGTSKILISLYSGSATTPYGTKLKLAAGGGVVTDLDTNITGGWVSTGIYSASFALTAAANPLTKIYDVWHSGSVDFLTSSFLPAAFPRYGGAPTFDYVSSVTNLKPRYSSNETARFRVFVRKTDWEPTIYTVATNTITTQVLPSASFSVVRVTDNLSAIPYGTSSTTKHTYLSQDVTGNYFDVNMNLLEKDYAYKIKLAYYNDSIGSWVEQPETFKFRVEE